MIEISHKQAQHLIRQAMDRRLPEEQWSALQGHMERCAECRAYRQRLTASERSLSRLLRLRWNAARGPASGLAARLLKTRERRRQRRKFLGKASWYVLGALLLIGAYNLLRAAGPATQSPAPTAVPTRAAAANQPTAVPALAFRGLVAFASSSSGNSEIYLLGAGAGELEVSNMTNSKAEDTHPLWSPDGEWLAFLSDRGEDGLPTGRNDLYAMTIAGSRLTRLTSRPDIYWQGPLEWSYDGQWIVLTGRQGGPDGPSFLYLVPASAENDGEPSSIAFTRGVLPWARFSSSQPLLAYNDPNLGLVALNINTGQPIFPTEDMPSSLRSLPSGAFDWSLGGRSLVYVAEGPDHPSQPDGEMPLPQAEAASLLRISPELGARGAEEALSGSANTIDRLAGLNQIRAVSWAPNSLLVAGLYNRDGCWTVHLAHAYNQQVPHRYFNELCVEGGLERSNWTTDGNWLVLLARRPEESQPALYALRVAEDSDRQTTEPHFERLADVDRMEGVEAALRVRPVGRSLGINPPAAGEPRAAGPREDAERLASRTEWIYYTSLQDGAARIFRVRPDGSQQKALTRADSDSWCPRVGPDGRVAFLNHDRSNQSEVNGQVFLMDADGRHPVKLTEPTSYEGGYSRSYNCPIWSPDGQSLAAYVFGRGAPGLAILPVDGSPARHYQLSVFNQATENYPPMDANPARFPSAEEFSLYGSTSLLWLPNDPADPVFGGDRILMVLPPDRLALRLVEFNLSQAEDGDTLQGITRAFFTGWHKVQQLALSPDGSTLALLNITFNRTQFYAGPTIAQVRLVNAATFAMLGGVPLTNFDARTAPYSRLAWLPDGQLGLLRSTGVVGAEKSILERIDIRSGPPYRLVQRANSYEDLFYDFASYAMPNADGGWLVFAAESGLYTQRYSNFLAGGIPAKLTDALVFNLDIHK